MLKLAKSIRLKCILGIICVLSSANLNASFALADEELQASLVVGPCWFIDGDFNREFYSGGELNREVAFLNCGENPLVSEIKLLGYTTGNLRLFVKITDRDVADWLYEEVKKYGIVAKHYNNFSKANNSIIFGGTVEQLRIVLTLISKLERFNEATIAVLDTVISADAVVVYN